MQGGECCCAAQAPHTRLTRPRFGGSKTALGMQQGCPVKYSWVTSLHCPHLHCRLHHPHGMVCASTGAHRAHQAPRPHLRGCLQEEKALKELAAKAAKGSIGGAGLKKSGKK